MAALGSTDNGLSRDGHAADQQVRLEGAAAHLAAGGVDRDGLDVAVVDVGPLHARGADTHVAAVGRTAAIDHHELVSRQWPTAGSLDDQNVIGPAWCCQ